MADFAACLVSYFCAGVVLFFPPPRPLHILDSQLDRSGCLTAGAAGAGVAAIFGVGALYVVGALALYWLNLGDRLKGDYVVCLLTGVAMFAVIAAAVEEATALALAVAWAWA